jgi:hypothetical protein
MLVPAEVGQNGKQHIQEKLAKNVDSIPRLSVAMAFFSANILSTGYSFAVAQTTQNCNLNNFDEWCGSGGEEAKKLLAKWIWEFINKNSNYICLIDETQSKVSDPSWQNDMLLSFSDSVRSSESAIFYHVSSNTISQEKLSELVEATFWFPFYCIFITDTNRIMETLTSSKIPEEQLSILAKNARGLVTDAYDLEGLLLWTKQQAFSLNNPF